MPEEVQKKKTRGPLGAKALARKLRKDIEKFNATLDAAVKAGLKFEISTDVGGGVTLVNGDIHFSAQY